MTGGILGVAFAITSGAGTETALLLGLPIATLTLILKNIYLGMFIPMLSQKADGYAERADLRGIERMHLIAGFGLSLMLAAVVTVSFPGGQQRGEIPARYDPGIYQTWAQRRHRHHPGPRLRDARQAAD